MTTDREIVRQALDDAIGWQRDLADAYAHIKDSPERAEALAQIKRYRAVLRRRYGKGRSSEHGAKKENKNGF